MNYLFPTDFKYAGFGVSRYNLQDYLTNIKNGRSALGVRRDYYSFGIVDSIIDCIATNDVQFNVKDQEICNLLEEIVRVGGHDDHGVYSESAHQAMRNLCIMQGKNPDNHILYNKDIAGRVGQAKNKIKSVFGFGKKKKQEPQSVPTKSNKNKILYRVTATLTGLVAAGAALFMSSDLIKSTSEADAANGYNPTFKTVSVGDTTHSKTLVYNLDDQRKPQTSLMPVVAARPTLKNTARTTSARAVAVAPVATDSVSVQLTRSSQSALNILLGEKKANELCRQIQAKIDAGIFAAPRGMSVPRIAHAMTMSRIYEGKSVILDALKSTVPLTTAQQAAFEHHIDEIGDLGVKLQKRMASKHQLSNHSRYAHASKALQKVHIKNIKQLKQVRKMAHTR